MPELLAHERQSHELGILVTVADDEMIGAFAEREHRLELRFASTLQPHPVRCPELHDLLDDVSLLIDLDRVDRGVAALVSELLNGRPELLAQRFYPRPQDLREPEQERKADPLLLEIR